jgi:hypothetical protein
MKSLKGYQALKQSRRSITRLHAKTSALSSQPSARAGKQVILSVASFVRHPLFNIKNSSPPEKKAASIVCQQSVLC